MKNCEELIINWLNNAYSMETNLTETLERHAKDAEEFGDMEMSEKLKKHIEETKQQAETVKNRIEELGGSISGVKLFMGKMMGEIQGVATEMSEDQIVKNSIMEYASEYFERATYKSIAVAAEECGDDKTAEMCRMIKKDETTTGEMLNEDLESVVKLFIQKKIS